MLTVLSVNLQNYYGDKDYRTYSRKGHNQTHILADEIVGQAEYHHANVICTQEDEHGLALSGYEEVAAACAGDWRKKEVVRTYVQRDWAGRCMHAETTVPWSEACPLPQRCALVVQLPTGDRIANVFLAGGRMDDEKFSWYEACAHVRTDYIDRVLAHQPDIIVGDWNSDIAAQREDDLYKEDSDYVNGILHGIRGDKKEALRKWLHWRQTPFVRLRERHYEFLWPREATAGRGALAVDGFAYNPVRCEPEGEARAIHFMQHYTDHSGVVATFKMRPVERGGISPHLTATGESPISHLVRRPTKLGHEEPKLGVLFRATSCDARDASALSDCLKGSKALSAGDTEKAAALHVLMTGPMGLSDIHSPFVSCTAALTAALMFASQHGLPFLWRFCPSSRKGIYDMRSEWGIRRLNKHLPQSARTMSHEGHSASVSWAKFQNIDSGKSFDQVLVNRSALLDQAGDIEQVRVAELPRAVWDLVEKQKGLWDAATQSYLPNSAFLKNEAGLRRLVFPHASPSDEDCLARQATVPVERRLRREPYLLQSSESEIEDPDSGAPVKRAEKRKESASRKRSSRKKRSGRR